MGYKQTQMQKDETRRNVHVLSLMCQVCYGQVLFITINAKEETERQAE